MTIQNINEKGMDLIRKYRETTESRQRAKEQANRKAMFLSALYKAKADVSLKRNHFNHATDNKLLDCCIYELKAAESRLNYYMALAKREKLVNDEYMDMLFSGYNNERGVYL